LGYVVDGGGVAHGFVRSSNGALTTFDVPEAGTASGQGTFAFSLSPSGAIAGDYIDASNVRHRYLHDANGNITTFDAPDAGLNPGQGTLALNINAAGTIAGYDYDSSGVSHAFLRAPDGTFTTYEASGAGTGAGQGTGTASGIGLNSAGEVTDARHFPQNTFHHVHNSIDHIIFKCSNWAWRLLPPSLHLFATARSWLFGTCCAEMEMSRVVVIRECLIRPCTSLKLLLLPDVQRSLDIREVQQFLLHHARDRWRRLYGVS
jgi:hypothetical protein